MVKNVWSWTKTGESRNVGNIIITMKMKNESNHFKVGGRKLFAFAFAALFIGSLAANLYSADTNSVASSPKLDSASAATNSVAAPAVLADTNTVVISHALTGAELYSIHCNRCHQERYPTERTGGQWKTIMLHMQVRANLPVSQSRLILQYLQDNSGR